jgi:hypothetical protein
MSSATRRRLRVSPAQVAFMSSKRRGKTRASCKATAKKVRRAGRLSVLRATTFARCIAVGSDGSDGSDVAAAGVVSGCTGGKSLRRGFVGLKLAPSELKLVERRGDVAREHSGEQCAVYDGVQRLVVFQAPHFIETCGALESAEKQLSGKGLARRRVSFSVRFQPLPIGTVRAVFPHTARPASFT